MAGQKAGSKSDKSGKGGKLTAIKKMLFGEKKAKPPAKASAKSAAPKSAPKAAKGKSVVKAATSVAKAIAPAPLKAKKGASAPAPSAQKGQALATGKAKGAAPTEAKRPRASRSSFTSDEAMCREVACEGLATSVGYCRLHYIKNWKKIKRKELILKEGKLNQYIEELVAKYPDKYIEAIRQDLHGDKDFAKVIYDLDLDEGVDDFEIDGENPEALIDTIKRDFDDEGEGGF